MPKRFTETVHAEGRRGPLTGLRVLEFTHVAAGPFAGMLLADMGADVVKVESPSGDSLRGWPPIVPLEDGTEFSLNFASLNRNKRSVELDLKSADGLRIARDLIREADVVLENYRPGVMTRLGIGFEQVRDGLNDQIVYCSISGYGSDGPASQRGAFDLVIQAESGLMDVTGPADGDPAKCGVPVADFASGHYAAFAIACAMIQRDRHPGAVYIDCSMLESVLAISALQTSQYWGTGESPHRLGTAHPRNAPYQVYQARDRPFAIAAGNDRLWASVCRMIDASDLCVDPRFVSQADRVRNVDELTAILEERFATRSASEWIGALSSEGVPCALVNTYAEALQNEQLRAREFIASLPLPGGGRTPTTLMPLSFGGANSFGVSAPPLLGEHSAEVLAEWLPPHPADGPSDVRASRG